MRLGIPEDQDRFLMEFRCSKWAPFAHRLPFSMGLAPSLPSALRKTRSLPFRHVSHATSRNPVNHRNRLTRYRLHLALLRVRSQFRLLLPIRERNRPVRNLALPPVVPVSCGRYPRREGENYSPRTQIRPPSVLASLLNRPRWIALTWIARG